MHWDLSNIRCLNSLVFIVTAFLLISNLCCILVAIRELMFSQGKLFMFSFLVKVTVAIWDCVSIASHLDIVCVV